MTRRPMYGQARSGSVAPLALGLLAVAAGVVGAVVLSRRGDGLRHGFEDAPRRSQRRPQSGSARVVGRSVTIAKPREEVYRAWREFTRFPDFMENVASVVSLDDTRSRWSVEGPGGSTIEFVSRIVDDVPGERIAWTAEEGTSVPNAGRITFRDAPGDRGTVVDLTMSYDPPGGAVGAMVAKMFQREPSIQARRDLKRFKQLMETGEVATARTHPVSEDER
ncbi:SRPBCC family protein [Aquibium sp. ELW1220]|uniref:SRPBCC family protein n=1 Tax=Aquibium sp. ELW1220 TaxID=2976766 RepID=UPI0025B1ABC5|nr:SRPBCC family protein [Aquibium sp. ELW1220]MDN2579115.1 SRPBCC family protein [Aquibium sp. ELW1220]